MKNRIAAESNRSVLSADFVSDFVYRKKCKVHRESGRTTYFLSQIYDIIISENTETILTVLSFQRLYV